MIHRLFACAVALFLGVLALAGLEIGATAARGPGGIMSSELVVDGGRTSWGPATGKRGQRPPRARERDGEGDELSVHVARSAREVEELRPVWERLQGHHLTSDIDFFLTYMDNAPEAVRPHVLLVEGDGPPETLVVGRVEDGRLEAQLGYKTMLSTRLRTLTVAYGGVLGHVDERRAELVLDRLRGSLGPGEADLLRLRALEPGSVLHSVASGRASWLRRERSGPSVHWSSRLPRSLDEFLAPRRKKVRWQARKDVARLQEAHGDDVDVRVFTSRDDLDRLLRDSELVHRRTYQSALGVGFSTSRLHRSLTALALRKGWFRGYVLYLRGKPVAFWHGNAYRGRFGIASTGFDPAYAGDRPGGFLLMRLIEDLCADESVHTLDFGFGDATYKRQLGDERRLEEDVALFAPTPRAVGLNLARTALHGSTELARKALERSALLDDLKRRWRGRLAPRSKD